MSMVIPAPIALFVYNRPEHVRRLLDSLCANDLISDSELHVFSDGPKAGCSDHDMQQIMRVREMVKRVDCCKNLFVHQESGNKGLAASILDGVTQVVEKYGKVIVLEDDLVVSKGFLRYMNEALTIYEEETDIWSVSGYMYPVKERLEETFFIRSTSCWGWGTWARVWGQFNRSGNDLIKKLEQDGEMNRFNFNGTYDYYGLLKQCAEGRSNSWAVLWYANVFLNKGLTLFPGKSLVGNMGFDGSGVHCPDNKHYMNHALADRVRVGYRLPAHSAGGFKAVIRFNRCMMPSYVKRIGMKIKSLFRMRDE